MATAFASTMTGGAESATADVAAARLVRLIGFVGLTAAALLGVVAAIELRPLHADGFLYFIKILETEAPSLPTPGRRLTEWVMQAPLLAAMALDFRETDTLTVVFGLGLQLLPIALTALCWPMLPAGRKPFFVFPLLHYFAGTASAGFAAIAAGPAAAAAFWLLLFHILFRMRGTRAIDATLLLVVPTVFLHEAMVFLAPILALAALWRARGASRRGDRITLAAMAVAFVAVAAMHADFIARPRFHGHGAGFFRSLLEGTWIAGNERQINLPALVGAVGLVLLGVLAALSARSNPRGRRAGWGVVAAFAAGSVAAAVYLAFADRLLAADSQFAARNNAALISLPLALAALFFAASPARLRPVLIRQVSAACAVMIVSALAWDAYATQRWSRYTGIMRSILESNHGYVEWDIALDMRPASERRLLRRLTHGWTVSSLSFALSRGGKIKTVLGESRPVGWRPFDPRDLNTLPRSRYWDTSAYREALFENAADTEWR